MSSANKLIEKILSNEILYSKPSFSQEEEFLSKEWEQLKSELMNYLKIKNLSINNFANECFETTFKNANLENFHSLSKKYEQEIISFWKQKNIFDSSSEFYNFFIFPFLNKKINDLKIALILNK